jgi:hypothetical protein
MKSSSLGFFLSTSSYTPAASDAKQSIEIRYWQCTLSQQVQSLDDSAKELSVCRICFANLVDQSRRFGILAVVQIQPRQGLVDLLNSRNQ